MRKDKSTKSIISKFVENASIQILNFIIGIVLARVLSPSDYGVYSILLIFISIGQTAVVAGLNSALIQRTDIDEADYSTVFAVSLMAALCGYCLLYIAAPLIAKIYVSPKVVIPLRVLSVVLFPQALHSVVNARIARRMEFPFAAKISIVSVIIAGIISVYMALNSAGIWALVVQQILTYTIFPIFYCIKSRWIPKPKFKFDRLSILLGFGIKVLAADLVNSVYANIQGMIIGIKYSADSLGFFNKGQMFPRTIMQTVNGSIENVMFPVYSDMQNDKNEMGNTILANAKTISFFAFPMMMGLFAVSNEVITLLLTEKWIDCVGIVKIFCIAYMFWPIDSMNLQAIKACGNGDAYVKVNFIKKCIAVTILSAFVFFSRSLEIFSLSAILIYISDIAIGSHAMKRLVGVSLGQELAALWRSSVCSSCILLVIFLPEIAGNTLLTLLYKIVSGVTIYMLSSYLLNRNMIKILLKRISYMIGRKKR
ncbi:MAG: lipopolysaccharide biosynthesis protein [Lachnospiraceae bacterium]|nr:lipopolysaccharide biosynthesis protein [Lachnospiraceae bacterium]